MAGFRSSIYGFRGPWPKKESFGKNLLALGKALPETTPTLVWIVGALDLSVNGCKLEFRTPADRLYEEWRSSNISFADPRRHESHHSYLSYFDSLGIKVFLQVEPGMADVAVLIELVMGEFSSHPCVAGFGVDVEWYQGVTEDSGIVVTDEVAKAWEAQVKEWDPKYQLFLKHFDAAWLCPSGYRGDLVFVNDSQGFTSEEEFLEEFGHFAEHFYPNLVLNQIGYPRDKVWWAELPESAPEYLAKALAEKIRQDSGIIWVDFSLPDVFPIDD